MSNDFIDPDPKEPIETINVEAPGATMLAMKVHSGKVVLMFPNPVAWVALDPDVAARVADQMLGYAVELGETIEIKLPQKQINPVHRQAVINRVQTVMRQLQERGRRPEYIAEELTDLVIKGLL